MNRSACPHCRQTLRVWELVPVLSFLILRGRCARCRRPIAWQYPLVELLTAAAWVWAFWPLPSFGASFFSSLALAAIISTLILLWLIDSQHLVLPDVYLVCLGVWVCLRLWLTPLASPSSALIGALLGAGLLLAIWAATSGRGLGFGDVKLMLPLGLLFGTFGALSLLMLAFIAGGLVAAYLLATRRATLKTAVPFGPFLIAATAVLLINPSLPQRLFAAFLL